MLALLPDAFVRDLSPSLPAAALARLIRVLPGYRAKVPDRAGSDCRLALALTPQELTALRCHVKGATIEIPTGARLKADDLQQRIVRMEALGLSHAKIAQRLGVTARWVRKVLRLRRQANRIQGAAGAPGTNPNPNPGRNNP